MALVDTPNLLYLLPCGENFARQWAIWTRACRIMRLHWKNFLIIFHSGRTMNFSSGPRAIWPEPKKPARKSLACRNKRCEKQDHVWGSSCFKTFSDPAVQRASPSSLVIELGAATRVAHACDFRNAGGSPAFPDRPEPLVGCFAPEQYSKMVKRNSMFSCTPAPGSMCSLPATSHQPPATSQNYVVSKITLLLNSVYGSLYVGYINKLESEMGSFPACWMHQIPKYEVSCFRSFFACICKFCGCIIKRKKKVAM